MYMAETASTAGVPDAQEASTRERSTIDFPYLDLDAAIEVAKAVHQVGGTSCQWDQLAAQLGQSATGGGFRMRVATAKTFGLLNYSQGTVTLTRLGSQICDPDQEASAKVEAFLAVPLYKAVYDRFRGIVLPPAAGLEQEMVTLGVAAKQKDKARQAFQRSATSAGFFAFGTNRLVLPSIKNNRKAEEPEKEREGSGAGSGGGGAGTPPPSAPPTMHPFIKGLLDTLPPVVSLPTKSEWSMQGRREWLQTAAGIFNLIYKASDNDNVTLAVTVVPLPPTSSAH